MVMVLLYHAALDGQRARLYDLARSQSRLLTAMAASGLDAATVVRMMQHAYEPSTQLGNTGELSLARRDREAIVFLLSHRSGEAAVRPAMHVSALADTPIERALLGQSGSMIGRDYRGKRVLAAYAPVAGWSWGIVATIDLSEIRAPFVLAGFYAGGGVIALLLCGMFLFFYLINPQLRRLEESVTRHQDILAMAPEGVMVTSAAGILLSMNSAAEQLFGYPAADVIGQHVTLLLPTPSHPGDQGVQETIGQHRDGTMLPLEISTSTTRLSDQQVCIRMLRNTSKRQQAEEALQQSSSRLERWAEERTSELRQAHKQLQKEVLDRLHMQAALRTSQDRFRDLAAHLQTLQEAERRRIAREIHDELGQGLAGLNMDVSWLARHLETPPEEQQRHLQAMATHLATLIDAVRRINLALRPGVVDDLGLVAALEAQLQDTKRRSGLMYDFSVDPEDLTLDPERATAVFRIFQAALTNVLRHAKATAVTVGVRQQTNAIVLEVADNGCGITPEHIADPNSLGLIGMRERAHLWGGSVTFDSQPHVGTTVRVQLPLDRPEAQATL
jgi:PAS domain S-box-containing protein